MSRAEKRYFTLDAQKSGRKDSKYFELFQLINAMEEYNEAKLKKRFPKNLPYDKAYLYEAILRSMRDYRNSKSKSAKIKELILDSKYLYERGLYSQTEVRLKEAKELAHDLDDQLALLEINKEERRLTIQPRKKNYETILKQLEKQASQYLESLAEEFEFEDIYFELLTQVIQTPNLKDEKLRLSIKENSDYQSLTEEDKAPNNNHALRRYFQSAANYYRLLDNLDQADYFYSKVVEWWEERPKYKEEEFFRYIVDVSNLLQSWAHKGKYDLFLDLLSKLENENPPHYHEKRGLFRVVSSYKLIYFLNTGNLEGADELVEAIDDGLRKFKFSMNPSSRLILIFNVSVLLFILERFERSVKWNEKVIKEEKFSIRQDIQNGVHLLNLIATYELDDIDEIENTIRSTNRFFTVTQGMTRDDFELKVLDYIKKLFSAPLDEVSTIYQDFKTYLLEAKKSPKRKDSLGIGQILLYWINSKIERRSILDLMYPKRQRVRSSR